MDFLGWKNFEPLTKDGAIKLQEAFVELYNNLYGCESQYAREAIECPILCFGEESSEECCGTEKFVSMQKQEKRLERPILMNVKC